MTTENKPGNEFVAELDGQKGSIRPFSVGNIKKAAWRGSNKIAITEYCTLPMLLSREHSQKKLVVLANDQAVDALVAANKLTRRENKQGAVKNLKNALLYVDSKTKQMDGVAPCLVKEVVVHPDKTMSLCLNLSNSSVMMGRFDNITVPVESGVGTLRQAKDLKIPVRREHRLGVLLHAMKMRWRGQLPQCGNFK